MTDLVEIKHNNLIFKKFASVRITKRMETFSHEFHIELPVNSKETIEYFDLNKPLDIIFNDELLLRGYIYKPKKVINQKGLSVTLSGSSITSDLVHSEMEKTAQFENIALNDLLKKLIEGYEHIKLLPADKNPKIDLISTRRGESIYQCILKASKICGLLPITTKEGYLYPADLKNLKSSGKKIIQGKNLRGAICDPDYSEIFSMYHLDGEKNTLNPWAEDENFKSECSQPDISITRKRIKIVKGPVSGHSESKEYLSQEINRRNKNLNKIIIYPHFEPELTQILMTHAINIPDFNIKKDMICAGMSLNINQNSVDISLEMTDF